VRSGTLIKPSLIGRFLITVTFPLCPRSWPRSYCDSSMAGRSSPSAAWALRS